MTASATAETAIEALTNECEQARRHKRPLSVVMIDMSSLKANNDIYGHPAGDAALKMVADVIGSQFRRVDMPARFGGDELVILLPEVELELAVKIAERICDKIKPSAEHEEMFSVSGRDMDITSSAFERSVADSQNLGNEKFPTLNKLVGVFASLRAKLIIPKIILTLMTGMVGSL